MQVLSLMVTFCTLAWAMTACSPKIHTSHVANGWASNAVNTAAFRHHALYSFHNTQYIAFYDNNSNLILGKRTLGTSQWQLQRTPFKGNAYDPHNSISLIMDQNGYLHVSWDQHNSYLRYASSTQPESLILGAEQPMTGRLEKVVTYPEFHELKNGDLLFAYRSDESGKGDLVLNRFDLKTRQWTRLHDQLLDGEGKRTAYWQMTIDDAGVIHLTWTWRETAATSGSHDICYAQSSDGGHTWTNSANEPYRLPITPATGEVACTIPEASEISNQASITTDRSGNPIIASYWKGSTDLAPQYRVIYLQNNQWQTYSLDFRKSNFDSKDASSKTHPISKPQVVTTTDDRVMLVFRDEERDHRVSVASASLHQLNKWKVRDLTDDSFPGWEPNLDPVVWKQNQSLHLFLQHTTPAEGKGLSNTPPTAIKVLEWDVGF